MGTPRHYNGTYHKDPVTFENEKILKSCGISISKVVKAAIQEAADKIRSENANPV